MLMTLARMNIILWILILNSTLAVISTPIWSVIYPLMALTLLNAIFNLLPIPEFIAAAIYCTLLGGIFSTFSCDPLTTAFVILTGILAGLTFYPNKANAAVIRRLQPEPGQSATPRQIMMLRAGVKITRIARLVNAFTSLMMMRLAANILSISRWPKHDPKADKNAVMGTMKQMVEDQEQILVKKHLSIRRTHSDIQEIYGAPASSTPD